MELNNHTNFSAMLYRGCIDEHRFAAAVMTRITYDIVDGQLAISEEQPWEMSNAPWECEYGPMESDEVFYRGGVDVLIFGSARTPGGQARDRMNVSIEIGTAFRRQLAVFGNRVWQRRGDQLVPGSPEPFTAIPLTLDHAYGGSDEWDELQIPYSGNPLGKGYYIEAETAGGGALPNLEAPGNLITHWEDQPDPVAVSAVAQSFGPRLREGLIFDEDSGALSELRPCFFNAASPMMIAPSVSPGERVVLDGVLESGPLSFILPDTRLRVRLVFADEIIDRWLTIDQIGIEPDRQRVFITYRHPFRYVMIPMQERSCTLEHFVHDAGRTGGIS